MKPNESKRSIPALGRRSGSDPGLKAALVTNLMYAAGAAVLSVGLLRTLSVDPIRYVNTAERLVQNVGLTCRMQDALSSISIKMSEGIREIRTQIRAWVEIDSLKFSTLQVRRDYEERAANLLHEPLKSKTSDCDCQGQASRVVHAIGCSYPRRTSNRSTSRFQICQPIERLQISDIEGDTP